jgi:hypothetical protein
MRPSAKALTTSSNNTCSVAVPGDGLFFLLILPSVPSAPSAVNLFTAKD